MAMRHKWVDCSDEVQHEIHPQVSRKPRLYQTSIFSRRHHRGYIARSSLLSNHYTYWRKLEERIPPAV